MKESNIKARARALRHDRAQALYAFVDCKSMLPPAKAGPFELVSSCWKSSSSSDTFASGQKGCAPDELSAQLERTTESGGGLCAKLCALRRDRRCFWYRVVVLDIELLHHHAEPAIGWPGTTPLATPYIPSQQSSDCRERSTGSRPDRLATTHEGNGS